MIPVRNTTLTTVVTANESAQPDSYAALIREWQEWENTAQSGSGEYRDMAITRLKSCLKNSEPVLDLSGLQLQKLPVSFPHFLKTIYLSGFEWQQTDGVTGKFAFSSENPRC